MADQKIIVGGCNCCGNAGCCLCDGFPLLCLNIVTPAGSIPAYFAQDVEITNAPTPGLPAEAIPGCYYLFALARCWEETISGRPTCLYIRTWIAIACTNTGVGVFKAQPNIAQSVANAACTRVGAAVHPGEVVGNVPFEYVGDLDTDCSATGFSTPLAVPFEFDWTDPYTEADHTTTFTPTLSISTQEDCETGGTPFTVQQVSDGVAGHEYNILGFNNVTGCEPDDCSCSPFTGPDPPVWWPDPPTWFPGGKSSCCNDPMVGMLNVLVEADGSCAGLSTTTAAVWQPGDPSGLCTDPAQAGGGYVFGLIGAGTFLTVVVYCCQGQWFLETTPNSGFPALQTPCGANIDGFTVAFSFITIPCTGRVNVTYTP